MFRNLVFLATLIAAPAFAGLPGGQQPAAPVAPAAQPATTPAPVAQVPATPAASNGPLGRTSYTLATPDGCAGLQIAGAQQVQRQTAVTLQQGATDHLTRCLDAQGRYQLSLAAAGVANPQVVTRTDAPDGTVTTVIAPALSAERDYVNVSINPTTGAVERTEASGTAAVWAAARPNNGFTAGVYGNGSGNLLVAQSAAAASFLQPQQIMLPPAAPNPPPSTTRSAPSPSTKPAPPPPPAAPSKPPSNTAAAEAVLEAARR